LKRQRDEAYVLRTQELGETDLIVSLFARHHGKVRGVARAARKSRRRFGGLLEPLTRVSVGWIEKPGRDLQSIDSMEGLRSFATMQSDPAVQAACAVVSEVTEVFAREGQRDEKAFKLIGAILGALESGCDPWVTVRYFEYWMLHVHGLLPDLTACSECGRSLSTRKTLRVDSHGALRCSTCAQPDGGAGRPFGARERAFLEAARITAPSAMQFDPRTVRPGGGLAALLRGTLESFAEKRFRAYRHLSVATGRTETGAGA
jgi:DNA repair protein RecO (recombination protein O)